MTRFLSESLQAREPFFRTGLRRLEAANGHPSHDIRLSSEVTQQTKTKLRELGLDPHDTTVRELYHVLQERVKADDARLVKTLRTQAASHVSAEGNVVDGIVHALKQLPDSKRCFALKSSSLRSLLKKQPPNKALKQLGYRSVDSFLKHETPASALAAAWLSEGSAWQNRFLDLYKKLGANDFEDRNISVIHLDSPRWRALADQALSQTQHNILSFKELGAVLFLPFYGAVPDGAVTASLALALHGLNEIRASSTFLKLCQVRPDFGQIVKKIASDEPRLSSQLLTEPLPWQLVQRYYARLSHLFREDVFGPHIQADDMVWHSVEKSLSSIEPSLAFWHDTAHLGLLHDKQPVSLNIVDAAINYCNQLPFEQRAVHYFQRSLWHELLLRYLRREPVEQSVLAELQPKLALETVLA